MRRTFVYLTIAVLLVSLVPLSSPVSADGPGAPIRLKAATFRPGLGEKPDLPPGLAVAAAKAGVNGYYLVQFAGPVQAAWKEALAGLGADLLGYVPDYAFKVRMTPGQARKAARLDGVAWVGDFHPAYKLSPSLAREGSALYTVRVERGANAGLTAAAVAATGAEVLSRQGSYLRVLADASQLDAIARVLDVAWVQNLALQEKHNEYAAGGIMGATIANGLGYDGSSQIAAVADTGLGDGTQAGAHPDIPDSRIVQILDYSYPDAPSCYYVVEDGPQDVDSGHGTHCSGSVLGGGDPSTGIGKGVAPAASLVFQAVEEYLDFVRGCARQYEDGYWLFGIPDDIRDLFQDAYDLGARIHSNSWGHDAAGDYDVDAANADDFVWNNPDFVITTSAGNAGVDANADGIVDNDSMGSPATAKNIITVGASENDRQNDYPCDNGLTYTSHDAYQPGVTCFDMGYNQDDYLGTWGQRYGDSFLAEPLYSDVTAGNQEQMASWSSRGPTDDARVKPDVVAPGTWILSAFSTMYQEYYDAATGPNPANGLYQWDGWGMPASETYKYMGGTSMSNPLVAGGATVVRDYFFKAHSHNASAALVKATLINSADDLLDENNDGADDNDYPIPNVHEGWGRVNLVTATSGNAQFEDETTGVGTGGTDSYLYAVASAGQPFKVSLVWSDYPSTEAASTNLVNNLNLKVTAPGGTVYWGNNFSGGWTVPGGSAEAVNNVENVYVQSAAAGTWTVEVLGGNVPFGPQPYALVVDGVFGAVDNPPIVSIVAPVPGAAVSGSVAIEIDATDVEDAAGTLTVEWNVDGGDPQTAGYNSQTGYYEATWNSASVGDGPHTINAQATDSASNVGSDSSGVTVDNVNDPPVATFSFDCTQLSCDFDASGSYDPDGSIVSYAWDFGDTNSGSGVAPSHTYDEAGTYTVILTVTDNESATGTDTQTVSVSDTVPTLYVADIAMTGKKAGPNRSATAIVTIHEVGGVPVAGATVYGTWSGLYNASVSGVTLADGTITFNSGKVKSGGTFTFTVDDVVKSGYTYDPALNAETTDSVTVP